METGLHICSDPRVSCFPTLFSVLFPLQCEAFVFVYLFVVVLYIHVHIQNVAQS